MSDAMAHLVLVLILKNQQQCPNTHETSYSDASYNSSQKSRPKRPFREH